MGNDQIAEIQVNTNKKVLKAGTGIGISADGETITASLTLGPAATQAKAGDTTTITNDQIAEIQVNTNKKVLKAGTGISISADGETITANVLSGNIRNALDAIEAADTTTAAQKEYRLERMILILCNTFGLKFEHLVRAVDVSVFDPYERFKFVEVTNDSPDLCTSVNTVCVGGYSAKNALARC